MMIIIVAIISSHSISALLSMSERNIECVDYLVPRAFPILDLSYVLGAPRVSLVFSAEIVQHAMK